MATDLANRRRCRPGGRRGALLLAGAFSCAPALASYQCEGLLMPTEEARATDYQALQAYARVNPTYLYDAIAKAGPGGATFGGFAEDYRQSTSRGDFPKRVHKRLQDENFTLPDVIAKSYYRRALSDAQVNAWMQCASQSPQGAILATARNVSPTGFNLVVAWAPPAGVGTAPMEIDVLGGTIAGLPSMRQTMTGRSWSSFEIRAASARPVRVNVSIAGAADSVIVSAPKASAPAATP